MQFSQTFGIFRENVFFFFEKDAEFLMAISVWKWQFRLHNNNFSEKKN